MPIVEATANQLVLPFEPGLALAADLKPLEDVIDREAVHDLHRRLGRCLGEPIDLVTTSNRRTLVSWRRLESGLLRVRCLRGFARANDEVVLAMARFIRSRDADARRVVEVFAASMARPRRASARPRYAPPQGRVHDLRNVYRRENRERFAGAFSARIGWSFGSAGRVRRSIRLGSWQPDHRLIKVHPVLDSKDVPDYVLDFVVFHEMLHGVVGSARNGNRTVFHTPVFRQREAQHPAFERAQGWIHENLDALLSY
ncbi:MAG: hypothetical protein KDA24_11020 [Deltaproteobacteria bacterium]|nr:hypothetical protein [Deltaproteobacteria bacterium]